VGRLRRRGRASSYQLTPIYVTRVRRHLVARPHRTLHHQGEHQRRTLPHAATPQIPPCHRKSLSHQAVSLPAGQCDTSHRERQSELPHQLFRQPPEDVFLAQIRVAKSFSGSQWSGERLADAPKHVCPSTREGVVSEETANSRIEEFFVKFPRSQCRFLLQSMFNRVQKCPDANYDLISGSAKCFTLLCCVSERFSVYARCAARKPANL